MTVANSSGGIALKDALQHTISVIVLLLHLHVFFTNQPLAKALETFLKPLIAYIACHMIWYYSGIHEKYGFWKCKEPKSHMIFAIQSSWIVPLMLVGGQLSLWLFNMDFDRNGTPNIVLWEFGEQHKYFRSTSTGGDWFWAILFFYITDLTRYWAHRIGHYGFFFKTFPFSHASHHNQMFVNPLSTFMSPLCHLAQVATYFPIMLLGATGLHKSSIICYIITIFPTLTQHLGCDPFPWLTRFNHYYCYGLLPWIPLYHSYHHNPFIKTGNFGNGTAFWDYLFDTVQPESIYHIEHGHPPEKIQERCKDPVKLEKIFSSMLKGKNRLDMNNGYTSEMFSMHVI